MVPAMKDGEIICKIEGILVECDDEEQRLRIVAWMDGLVWEGRRRSMREQDAMMRAQREPEPPPTKGGTVTPLRPVLWPSKSPSRCSCGVPSVESATSTSVSSQLDPTRPMRVRTAVWCGVLQSCLR